MYRHLSLNYNRVVFQPIFSTWSLFQIFSLNLSLDVGSLRFGNVGLGGVLGQGFGEGFGQELSQHAVHASSQQPAPHGGGSYNSGCWSQWCNQSII